MTIEDPILAVVVAAAQEKLLSERKKLGIEPTSAPPQGLDLDLDLPPVFDSGLPAPAFPPERDYRRDYSRDYPQERQTAAIHQVEHLAQNWGSPLSGTVLWTARCLVTCGLPVNPTPAPRVVRTARLSDGTTLRVTFIRTHDQIPLPFRQDRAMMHFLAHKAVVNQSPEVRWTCIKEYLDMFGIPDHSGKNCRLAQERFIRVVYMDLMIEVLDSRGRALDVLKIPFIEHARISAKIDGEGNWTPMDTAAEMLKASDSARVGQLFYDRMLRDHQAIPIPVELLIKTYHQPRVQDFAVFLFWRAFAAGRESLISWEQIQGQFDSSRARLRDLRGAFREALLVFRLLPDPFPQIRVEVGDAGLTIFPLPRGTCFFPGFPKRNGPLSVP